MSFWRWFRERDPGLNWSPTTRLCSRLSTLKGCYFLDRVEIWHWKLRLNMTLEVLLKIIMQVGMGQSPTVPSHLSDEGKEPFSP